jgi:predicted DNA binding CopG/RHH family protein
MSDLEEVVAEARKHGMSYGKYVNMLKQEEQMTQELKDI